MASQVVDRGVVEGAHGRVLDGANHPFGLPNGPRVIRLGEPVLNMVFGADPSEDVGAGATFSSFVLADELNAVIGQHRVDLVEYRHEQRLEETRRDQLRRLPVDPGEDQLGCAVDGHEQIGLAALVAQFSDVEVEVAYLVGFEPLGFFAIGLRQARDAVPLKAAVQRRARQVWDNVLLGDEDIVQRQAGLHA